MSQLSELLLKTNLTNSVTKELYTRSISKLEFDDRGYLMNEPVESNKELLVVIKVLADEVDRLECEALNYLDQEELVDDLTADIVNLNEDIEELEYEIGNRNNAISELNDILADKDTIIEDLESDKRILESGIKDLQEKIESTAQDV
jgi:uncharacterized coiled-coil protein SlyX